MTSSAPHAFDPSIMDALAAFSTPAFSPPAPTRPAHLSSEVTLSDEQQRVIDVALLGKDIIVDATVGSGKTSTIQRLCNVLNENNRGLRILYLTYSKLLKEDAQQRVKGAKVQNYHGIVYPSLLGAGIKCGISESIATFNARFNELSANFPVYDVLIIDEYQDITEEYAQLLRHIKSKNPVMQIIMVGDMEQRVSAASRHNAQEFAKSFCVDPEFLSFTQSFRIGERMANELSTAWNKPIVGVNDKQEIHMVSYNEAVKEMLSMKDRPGDILCLGKRNGMMTDALNFIENRAPEVFNKNTVYASVRDGGDKGGFSPSSSIFTTFDSSKGLERDTCFIFDYTEKSFDTRLKFKDSDSEVLRNVFLVAASRGKNRVFFVDSEGWDFKEMQDGMIGYIDVDRFVDLPDKVRETYEEGDAFEVSSMFDFKYVETVDETFDLLDTKRLDDGKSHEIDIELSDGLIDLWSVMNVYQKYSFFENFVMDDQISDPQGSIMSMYESAVDKMMNIKAARWNSMNPQGRRASAPSVSLRNEDISVVEFTQGVLDRWELSLAFVAAVTNYDRYATQVDVHPGEHVMAQIHARLSEHLDPRDIVQEPLFLAGEALWTRAETTPIEFVGVADVVRDDAVWGLHYVSELTHPLFLRAAMLSVMAGKDKAIIWNIRTNERHEIHVPDRQRFLDAVVNCVTKQNYRTFRD